MKPTSLLPKNGLRLLNGGDTFKPNQTTQEGKQSRCSNDNSSVQSKSNKSVTEGPVIGHLERVDVGKPHKSWCCPHKRTAWLLPWGTSLFTRGRKSGARDKLPKPFSILAVGGCLSFFAIAVIKWHDKINLRKKKQTWLTISSCSPSWKGSHSSGSWRNCHILSSQEAENKECLCTHVLLM